MPEVFIRYEDKAEAEILRAVIIRVFPQAKILLIKQEKGVSVSDT